MLSVSIFNVARYLTDSLRGPVLAHYSEADRPSFRMRLFNFLYTLWVYRSCICILIYIVKSCHQHPYGFQNSMSSWGVGVRFSKLPYSHDFFKIMQKVRCFKNTLLRWTFFQFDVKLGSRF